MLISKENKGKVWCEAEKIRIEVERALLTYEKPSKYFEMLRVKGELDEYFSEVKALINVIQSPIHYPEGDVWNHTMMVLDALGRSIEQDYGPNEEYLKRGLEDFYSDIENK